MTNTETSEQPQDPPLEEKGVPEAEESPNGTVEATEETTTQAPPPKRRRGRPPKKSKGKSTTSSSTDTTNTPSTPASTSSSKRHTPKTPQSNKSAKSIPSPRSSSKRVRKAAETFEPIDFKEERLVSQELKQYFPGRGVSLSSLEKVKANIQKNIDDPIVAALYKFIFGTMGLKSKGKSSAKTMKSALLDFSGYLSSNGETTSDAELQGKFESKALEINDILLKSFLTILHIECPVKISREDKITKLLAFLAEPSESHLVQTTHASRVQEAIAKSTETRKRGRTTNNQKDTNTETPGKSSTKRVKLGTNEKTKDDSEGDAKDEDVKKKEVEVDEHPEDDDKDEIIDGKTIPSAKKLRAWVKAYVECFDLDKHNAKHAIDTASDKFRVDLNVKKPVLMDMLKDAISLSYQK